MRRSCGKRLPLAGGPSGGAPGRGAFPGLGVETPSVSCADSSLGAGALPGRIWNPPLRPLRQPAAATSPGGERLLLTGGGVRGFACQRCRISVGHRAEGSGETCATFSYVSPAILGTFGAQKYRIGAGHADVLPYHSCRRHTARFLPPSQHPPGPSPAPRAVYGLPVPPPLCFFAKAAHVKLTCAATSAIISLKEVIPWN